MRLHITNEKNSLVHLVCQYLLKTLKDKKVDLILNGDKKTGVVKDIYLAEDDTEYNFINIAIGKKIEQIPLLDDTKARLGQELVVFETKSHTTVIEIVE